MNKYLRANGLARSLAIATMLALAGVAARAQGVIEAITGSVQGGSEVIRIDLAQPLAAVPTGFAIQSPARIALDFPGVTNAMGRVYGRDQPGQSALGQCGSGR